MDESKFRIACDNISYRKGFIEVMRVHPKLLNLEAWQVDADWSQPLDLSSDIPDEAIVANIEIELTIAEARALAAALAQFADDAATEVEA